jgi:hypothetical protein
MPTTAPLSVRRSPDPAPSRPQTRSPRAADEVYGFLSKFTAGVQQGLEAVRTARGDLSGA